MPLEINCSSCQRRLRVPEDLLGQMVRCPTCQATFTAEEEPALEPVPRRARPAPRFEEDSAEASPRPRRRRFSREDDDHADERDEYEEESPRRRRKKDVASAVAGPAIALMITSCVELSGAVLYGIFTFIGFSISTSVPQGRRTDDDIAIIAFVLLFVALAVVGSGIVLVGAIQMKRLRNYGFAMTSCILSMIPCVGGGCFLLSLPFGIWGVAVLSRSEVKDAFS